jgi:inhibitor of cysteine peptidase
MRGKWWTAAGVVAAAVVLTVVLVLVVGRGANGVHRLDAGDEGAVVELAVGERIVLVLEGNATTGYEWELVQVDETVVAPAGEPEYRSASGGDGAGGTYTFRFDAVGTGEATVTLVYRRSWEAEEPGPETRFTFTALVG